MQKDQGIRFECNSTPTELQKMNQNFSSGQGF